MYHDSFEFFLLRAQAYQSCVYNHPVYFIKEGGGGEREKSNIFQCLKGEKEKFWFRRGASGKKKLWRIHAKTEEKYVIYGAYREAEALYAILIINL